MKDDSKGSTTNLMFSPIDNCSDKCLFNNVFNKPQAFFFFFNSNNKNATVHKIGLFENAIF